MREGVLFFVSQVFFFMQKKLTTMKTIISQVSGMPFYAVQCCGVSP